MMITVIQVPILMKTDDCCDHVQVARYVNRLTNLEKDLHFLLFLWMKMTVTSMVTTEMATVITMD